MGSFDHLIPQNGQAPQAAPQAPQAGAFDHLMPTIGGQAEQAAAPEQGHFGDAMGQGLFGLADEAAGVIGASLGTFDPNMPDSTWSERYAGIRDSAKDNANAYAEREPGMAMAGELAGGVLAPGGIAMKAMDKVNKMGGAASTLGKVRKAGALSLGGAAEGAAYGAGSADPGERIEGAKQGAKVGAVASPLMAGAGNMVANKVMQNKANKALVKSAPSRESIKQKADEVYTKLDNMKVTMSQRSTDDMRDKLFARAGKEGFDQDIHKQTFVGLRKLGEMAGTPTTLRELDNARRVMSEAAKNVTNPSDARMASIMIEVIDDKMAALQKADLITGANNAKDVGVLYKQARDLWQKNKKSELLEEAVERGKLAASGEENGIRNEFRALLKNKKKMRGFSDDEKNMIKRVVNGTSQANVSKILGHLGLMGKGQSSVLGGGLGMAAGFGMGGLPGAAATFATGQLAKSNSARLTNNAADLASSVIRSGQMPMRDAPGKARSLYDAASIYAPQALLND